MYYSFLSIFKHCIDVTFDRVPENDYDFWVVAFHDEKDETLFRKDADRDEINRLKNDPDGYQSYFTFIDMIGHYFDSCCPHSVLSPGFNAVVVVEHCTVSPCAHQGSTRVGNQILWCIIFTAEKLLEI